MLESITSLFGPVGGLIVLAVALVLICLIGFLIYRLVTRPSFGPSRRNKQARLAITDAINFGPKHKLVLLRRDDIEHLVLIGGTTDLVVESNIRRTAAVRPREQSSREISTVAPPVEFEDKPNVDEKPAPSRLRPVANEAPTKVERPKFVPRQNSASASETADPAPAGAAVGISTPHVRSVSPAPEVPATPQPSARPYPAPMPPISPPSVTPAFAGGLVAAPLTTAAMSIEPARAEPQPQSQDHTETRESPFHHTPEDKEPTTITPRDDGASKANNRNQSTGSVADDMDALINELSAKR